MPNFVSASPTLTLETLLDHLEGARRLGAEYVATCPSHPDRTPSLSFREGDSGGVVWHCHAGCSQEDVQAALLELVNGNGNGKGTGKAKYTPVRTAAAVPPSGCTLAAYAAEKRLPVEFLQSLGLADCRYSEIGAVRIPYFGRDSEESAVRYRIGLTGDDRFRWATGNKPTLYGLNRLDPAQGYVVLVEGESDAQTLWHAGFPALGIPGAANWNEERDAQHLDGIPVVYVVIEPDRGGETLAKRLSRSRIRDHVRILDLQGFKDPSGLYLDSPERFKERFEEAMRGAVELPGLDEDLKDFKSTDLWNARRLVKRNGHRIRYCYESRKWLHYDGARWANDPAETWRLAKEAVESLHQDAGHLADSGVQKDIRKWALQSESSYHLQSMIELAQSESGIPVRQEDLDRDQWCLNVQNGTLDLKTGELREHRAADMHSKLAPVPYDAEAESPLWDFFLEKVLGGKRDLIEFVQRAVGYSLTGSTNEQAFFICYGGGQNGKSTFLHTLTTILGNYAANTPTETLIVKRDDGGASNDLARLAGTRFVFAVEAEEDKRLAEARLKQLTGGDKVTARMLYQEFAEYEPTFKIWLGTNHKPVIRETTLAMWRRVRLIPFSVTITEAEKDQEIAAKLLLEAPGILAWAVRGCLEWRKHGLGMAEDVRKATEEYRAESDEVGRFIEARCVEGPDQWVQATELYRAYQAWADSEGVKAMSQRAFGVRLSERGKDQDTRARKRGWSGLAPRDPSRDEAEPDRTGRTGLEPVLGKVPIEKSLGEFPENGIYPVPSGSPARKAEILALVRPPEDRVGIPPLPRESLTHDSCSRCGEPFWTLWQRPDPPLCGGCRDREAVS